MRLRPSTLALCFLALSFGLSGCGFSNGPKNTGGGDTTAPSITTQPANQTVTVGKTATFKVVATGTGLSYQWQKGTTAITGATSASYTTPATKLTDSGSKFSVVVSNSAGNVTSNAATLTVDSAPVAPSITQQPSNQTVTVGQTATFSVKATGTTPLTYQWQKGTTPISGATSATYTTPATTSADNGSQFKVVVSNSVGKVTSNTATLTVNTPPPPPPGTTDVLTYHNDIARTGQNLTETALTTSTVNSSKFGKIGFYSTDGLVDAEPLIASQVAVPGNGTHDLLIVASEHGTVYAFDANSGATIWKKSTLLSGETTSDDRGCGQVS
ncbi:MAG TPA: immunoglobulin domain-containing protein, partial [Candidatus Acidoferrales bacterium]|nr:immunoglobulin domain-containing protein [Candidatus Acidoferrales bacterium]